MRNPQTTSAPTFLTHIIARIDGVSNVVRRLGQISTRRRFCLSSAKITRGEPLRPFSFPQALKACICIIAAALLSKMKNRCWLGLVLVLNLALKRLFLHAVSLVLVRDDILAHCMPPLHKTNYA